MTIARSGAVHRFVAAVIVGESSLILQLALHLAPIFYRGINVTLVPFKCAMQNVFIYQHKKGHTCPINKSMVQSPVRSSLDFSEANNEFCMNDCCLFLHSTVQRHQFHLHATTRQQQRRRVDACAV